jgi:hypothetical protein
VICDAREKGLLGIDPLIESLSLERFFSLLHPEDRLRIRHTVAALNSALCFPMARFTGLPGAVN